VFFDAGYTLLKTARPESEVFTEQVFASCGIAINVKDVNANIGAMYQLYERLYEQDESFWSDDQRAVAIWKEMYMHLCSLLKLPKSAHTRIASAVFRYYLNPKSWAFFADVLPVLQKLKLRGYKLGIISNWDCSLTSIINGLNAASYFDSIIASADVRLHKPMPEIFALACERMNVCPYEAMHVGDHPTADVAGAHAAGLMPVFVNRSGKDKICDVLNISDFSQLLAVL
jgi:putative hydrolase of the HAD superfamily